MTLEPGRYECPEHRTAPTNLVQKAIEDDGPPVAYRRTRRRRQQSGLKPFKVIISCPVRTALVRIP
jgi:hypothetical protein